MPSMDARFLSLPPHKRFTRLQEQFDDKENIGGTDSQLPAKKRKGPREPLRTLYPIERSATFCLPTKKRVWADPPGCDSGTFFLPFDLNVECKPDSGCVQDEKSFMMKFDDSDLKDEPNGFPDQLLVEKENETELENSKDIVQLLSDEAEEEKNGLEVEDGISCAVCQSTDGDAKDPIVFCDGCDLMVHSTCYGNPLTEGIPEGDWFCSTCIQSRQNQNPTNKNSKDFSCCLCNHPGGALKRTTDKNGSWAHLLCALYVPEVFFDDPDGREGINYSQVPQNRWEGKCYICNGEKGCFIECSEQNCSLEFHVTCGLRENFSFEYKQGRKTKETIVAGFCKKHSELWEKQQRSGKFKIVARE